MLLGQAKVKLFGYIPVAFSSLEASAGFSLPAPIYTITWHHSNLQKYHFIMLSLGEKWQTAPDHIHEKALSLVKHDLGPTLLPPL